MFNRLAALFPCQSLESFDLDRREADAEQLLSSWSALWHPELLAVAQGIPGWFPAADPPEEPAGHLIVVPDCCLPLLPDGWLDQAEADGACLLRSPGSRDEVVAAALAAMETKGTVPPDLAADFLALGYCYLQVELLTRKYRYMSNLDDGSLRTAALAAAERALVGDAAGTKEHLQSAFDRLHESREYLYPLEAHLLDLTLVAPSTLGDSLRAELAAGPPRNLLVSGSAIEEMSRREPATLDTLKQALAAGSAALVGGEFSELPLPLLDPEAIGQNLARGLAAYQECLGQRPVVFGRRRFGLTPALPQVLQRFGFTGVFHCTLDDGRFPTDSQSRIQWEGIDGTAIESLGCLPIDAGRSESFLALAKKLNDAMGLDRTPVVVFAHWPGKSCCWYEDLRRIAAYGAALGKFSAMSAYVDETRSLGRQSHHKPDQYRSPYLKQEVVAGRRNPISRWARYFGRRAKIDAAGTLGVLATICAVQKGEGGRRKGEFGDRIEDALDGDEKNDSTLDAELATALNQPLAGFARTLAGVTASKQRGWLLVSTSSFTQRACVPPSSSIPSPISVEVPSMGFSWVDQNAAAPPPPAARKGWFGRKPKEPPPLAEENLLRNEFFEIRFDPATGCIRSISDYHSRGARLGQQIALRMPRGGPADAETNYSIMAADEIAVTSAGPVLGEIVSRGRLLDHDGRRVAGFRQTTRVWRGSRVVELLIDLEIERQPDSNPWDSYYAARFAWKDETATIHRGVSLARMPTELTQIESPHFVDICLPKQRTTLLCGGLPYHRRLGLRKLDTLLAVQGETARSFRLGIGIDVPNSTAAALGFLAPPLVLPDQPPPPASTGWFFHLDCRNVVATHWEPLSADADDGTNNSRGPTARGESARKPGFRVRLLESEGRGVSVGLRCFRAVVSAKKINAGDVPPLNLTVEGDRVDIPIGPHQWVEVEVELVTVG